jgi:hypothetical protein
MELELEPLVRYVTIGGPAIRSEFRMLAYQGTQSATRARANNRRGRLETLRRRTIPLVAIATERRGPQRFRLARGRVVLVVVMETKWDEIFRCRVGRIVIDVRDLQSLDVIILLKIHT